MAFVDKASSRLVSVMKRDKHSERTFFELSDQCFYSTSYLVNLLVRNDIFNGASELGSDFLVAKTKVFDFGEN